MRPKYTRGMNVGVLAIQGDFERHIHALLNSGAGGNHIHEVRTANDLQKVDRLIIPGGESTTVGLLLQRFGLAEVLQNRISAGMTVWGTCMGMILMAREIEDRPTQYCLSALDITVRRNAFGAQVHSFEAHLGVKSLETGVTGVFIRAPVVTQYGPKVEIISEYQGQIVAVRQGNCLGTSYHPELTNDNRMHKWFLSWPN